MTQTNVFTQRFEDAAELVEILDSILLPLTANKGDYPVVYVLDREGTQFSKASLREETLTDGSKVYHSVYHASK